MPGENIALLRQQALVAGQWVDALEGSTTTVTNPATGEELGSVPNLSREQVSQAIDSAQNAFVGWSRLTAHARAEVLRRWHVLIDEHREELAYLMTLEQGKPLAESRAEIDYANAFIQWFAEEGIRAYGKVIPTYNNDRRVVLVKQPVGVCAAITPWNFPAAMITRKVAPALAAGCTMIVKPAMETPFTALAMADLGMQAGLPNGVLSVVTGDAQEIGAELTSNSTVRKLSFTGSTAVGKLLMGQCAPSMKRLSLELGGNAPLIVFDDADMETAVQGCMDSKYRNTGQTCVCANRILVQADIYDDFCAELAKASSKLTVGSGLDEASVLGPLISEKALEKVDAIVEDARQLGAKVLAGGKHHDLGGLYYEPTVISSLTPKMRAWSEEIFGPVAAVARFETEEEAIRLANDTPYGLAAYFFTRDMARSWRVGEALQTGIVGVNTGRISSPAVPFGGVKESGIGREGGFCGIDEYLDLKSLTFSGIN